MPSWSRLARYGAAGHGYTLYPEVDFAQKGAPLDEQSHSSVRYATDWPWRPRGIKRLRDVFRCATKCLRDCFRAQARIDSVSDSGPFVFNVLIPDSGNGSKCWNNILILGHGSITTSHDLI